MALLAGARNLRPYLGIVLPVTRGGFYPPHFFNLKTKLQLRKMKSITGYDFEQQLSAVDEIFKEYVNEIT